MVEQKPSPFFVGEHLALDFLNSVASPSGQEIDWIENGDELISWLELASAIPPDAAQRFRTSGSTRALDAVAYEARELREWFRSFVRRHAGRPLRPEALSELARVNAILRQDRAYRQISNEVLAPDGPAQSRPFHWERKRQWNTPDTLLLPIADAIGDLICDADLTFVRQCEAPACTLWFHDVSKSHARRWCSMAVCGNRAKAAAHRQRARNG